LKKILIVDDHPEIRELLTITFARDDYQIFSAANGQQAIEIAQAEHPHVILLDIMMPGSEIDGLEVCRRLKADPATADIILIIVSAKYQERDIEAGLAVGADRYVVKPFLPTVLKRNVEEELRKRRPHKKLGNQ
jgi:DNA-binding response OmpR family regulator